MDIIIMTAQLLLGLSILVGLHELGHMLAAKYFGMRVENFSIGFPPKVFSFKKGETEYSLGAIPLGGFVKISGMVDESLDTKNLSKDPEPYEFRAKPAWQRLIVMMGGIIVNIITGMLIFIMLIYVYGEEYHSMSEVNKRGIVAHELGMKIGLQTGDKILEANGKPVEKFSEVMSPDVLLSRGSYYTIERNGEQITIPVPDDFVGHVAKKKELFVSPVFPYEVERLEPGMPAEKAGLKTGDKILEVNGKDAQYFHQLQEILQQNKGEKVDIKIERGNAVQELSNVEVDDKGRIGFRPRLLLETSVQQYSFGESTAKGSGLAFSVIFNTIRGFGKIFRGEVSASDSVSGPIGIAREFGGNWDWQRFWSLVGLLSMVLAFMNFLPIPALDGGHVMFLTYEMVSGRKPSDKFLERATKVGIVILLALMAFAIGNDVFKIFR